jgi:hypothetical protein
VRAGADASPDISLTIRRRISPFGIDFADGRCWHEPCCDIRDGRVGASRKRDFTMWQIVVIGICFWTLVFLLPR